MEETLGMKVNRKRETWYAVVLLACLCPHPRVSIPAGSSVVCGMKCSSNHVKCQCSCFMLQCN
jgi:hypothetical protein